MKKFLTVIALLIGIPMLLSIYDKNVNYYTIDATLYESYGAYVTIEDTTGNLWDVENPNICADEVYEVTFYTNGTDSERKDDKIVKIEKKVLTNDQ
jgi:outer membrane protein assembly factor BamE (lipoprotein component of BamABCDE complex)